jgi:hypothetical protein
MGNLNRCGRIAPIHWTVLLSAKASTSTERALRANDSDLMQNSGKILSGGWIGSIHITPPGAIYRVCMSARPARPWPWIPPLRRILEQSMCVDHSPSITFATLIRLSLLYYTYSVYARCVSIRRETEIRALIESRSTVVNITILASAGYILSRPAPANSYGAWV